MKPLLYIVATLSLAWITHAAPQPLSLINSTTISNLNDITPTTISEIVASDDNEQSTSLSTISDRKDSSDFMTDDGGTSISNFQSSESAIPREEADQVMTTDASVKESSPSSLADGASPTGSENTNEDKSELNISTTTETVVSKIPEREVNSEVTVSRYVPPLDPMKHMLMMADIKNIPKLSNFAPKPNTSPSPSTAEITTVENIESKVEISSTERSSTERPSTENSSTENSSTENSSTERSSTENFSTESSDVLEKVVAESSEVEEKHEPISTDTTLNDVIRSTVVMKSEDLSTERELISEASSTASSTEIIPTTESIAKESTSDSAESLEIAEEETSAILKNSEPALNIDDPTTEKETEIENDSETTGAVFITTEEAIKVEDLTSSDNLLKAVEELKLESSTLAPTTLSTSTLSTTTLSTTTENKIELKNSEISTVKENKDAISTTSTTSIPETTFESSSTGSLSSENERKNISLEDELEFRAVKIPLNFSKISYVEDEPEDSVDPEIVESTPQSSDETELTTQSILATISEILFSSSSTTETPETPTTERDSESTSISDEGIETTILPLSVDKEEISESQSDSGAVLINDSADMLKVQSIKSELDSVPVKETSTEIPTTEASASIQPEEIINDQPVEDTEPRVQDNNISTASEDLPETTKVSLSTLEDVSPTILTSTSTAAPNPEDEDLYEKPTEESKEELKAQEDPPTEEKPSDYLSNIKNRYVSGDNKDMVAAVQFLHYHDKASSEQCFKLVDAHWNYATNLTEDNKKKQLEQTLEYSLFHKEAWKNATSFAWKSFNDTLLRRWFKSLSVLGTAALPEDKLNEFNKLKAEMKNTYSTAKVCSYVPPQSPKTNQVAKERDCSLTLEPDLQRILTKSRDYDELVHVWKSWRDAAGKPIRDKYLRFVNLSNEAATLNGFSDTGDMWREAYESETFETDLEVLWDQLKPLYEHLHAYVRRRLISQYGSDKIKDDGPIPAHLFGNMWAQSWVSLLDITQPFSGKPSVDVTPNMEAKNLTSYDMFKISEEFFTSLGLKAMPEPFWKHSLIEKPKDREIICHASAWDFCNGKDYRIKQCTDITMEDLITVHHEMGHIQYFLQYARQPNVFREGANPGFHEAIGDVLALSVSTPKHLKSIGLLDDVADDPEGDLNFLLYTALDKVSFLPSGYLIDLWRWGLFSGEIKPEEMNTKWWELRLKYQGICPPVKRTDTDFDPGAKFHVPGNVPYIRYFVSFVIQFQFHKVLCDSAGHNGPLYKCDIYRSKEAGQILSQVMELGSSEHWSEAMKIMTGGATNKMDAGPILEYFDPLLQFLKEQNKNESLGWKSDDPTVCP